MKKYLLVLLFAGLLFNGCSKDKEQVLSQGKISLEKLDGTPVTATVFGKNRKKNFSFSNAKGKVVLAVYWSTSCPPCRAEIPHLVELQEKYPDKLKIYGILVEDKAKEDVKEFTEYFGMNYDVLYGEGNYELADKMGGVRGIPAMFLFDKQGKQSQHYVGLTPPEMIEADILKLF